MSDAATPAAGAAPALIDVAGQPALRLQSPDGASATVLLHGGQLLSWATPDGREQIYLSDRAVFADGTAVRGGVPVIFPQFGPQGPLPRHGFARDRRWQVLQQHTGRDDAMAVLGLADSEATRALWPHPFELELTLRVSGNRLDMELAVINTGEAPLSFTAALHTYLRVKQASNCTLTGLHRLRYIDQARGTEQIDNREEVQPEGELDRIYFNARRPVMLEDGNRHLMVHSEGFTDVVTWNPGAEKCAQLSDMPPDGWRHMLCVEAAVIGTPVQLPAGEEWVGRQSLVVESPGGA
jgi:glucose-6-phosphate 1-epimerase